MTTTQPFFEMMMSSQNNSNTAAGGRAGQGQGSTGGQQHNPPPPPHHGFMDPAMFLMSMASSAAAAAAAGHGGMPPPPPPMPAEIMQFFQQQQQQQSSVAASHQNHQQHRNGNNSTGRGGGGVGKGGRQQFQRNMSSSASSAPNAGDFIAAPTNDISPNNTTTPPSTKLGRRDADGSTTTPPLTFDAAMMDFGSQPMHLTQSEKEDALARTIHLRFLPTCMKQGELASICNECGPVNRVRICGGQNNNQNWIYGFVEFMTVAAANKMMKKSGMELYNGANKPPLRLKCHAAREPIVDRVFHDAERVRGAAAGATVAGGTPCTFGSGAFANRTIKEALDSYFSLVNKNGTAAFFKEHATQIQQQHMCGTSPGSAEMHPIFQGATGTTIVNGGGSDGSSVNGRTPTMPPSPQLLPPPTAASTFQLPPLHHHHLHHQQKAASAAGTATTTTALKAAAAVQSVDAKMASCMAFLDQAMRSGNAFAKSKSATCFFEAIGSLHSLHEALNNLQAMTLQSSSSSSAESLPHRVDDAHNNATRSMRIAAYLVAIFLHQLRGSLAEMLPCITKVMDVIAAVTMQPLEKPAALHVDPDDEDDDTAFLNALSLVHVSQPSAVISQHAYDTAFQHQCYLMNALIALGLGLERSNSLIARCAFTAARRRGASSLSMQHAALDQALKEGGIHTLNATLIAHHAATSLQQSSHDGNGMETVFASYFFSSYAEKGPQGSTVAVPPTHCVSVFPLKRGTTSTSS